MTAIYIRDIGTVTCLKGIKPWKRTIDLYSCFISFHHSAKGDKATKKQVFIGSERIWENIEKSEQ